MSELQDKMEAALYEQGRSAFWLFPDRWKDVAVGECMRFEEPRVCHGCSASDTKLVTFRTAPGRYCLPCVKRLAVVDFNKELTAIDAEEPWVEETVCKRCFKFKCNCSNEPVQHVPIDWADKDLPSIHKPNSLRCRIGYHKYIAGWDENRKCYAYKCRRCNPLGSPAGYPFPGPSDPADRVRLQGDWFDRNRKRQAKLWVDPTGVTLKPIRYDCSECGCPGWECVNPTMCPRSAMYGPAGIAGSTEREVLKPTKQQTYDKVMFGEVVLRPTRKLIAEADSPDVCHWSCLPHTSSAAYARCDNRCGRNSKYASSFNLAEYGPNQ